jgi:hypothetical protein
MGTRLVDCTLHSLWTEHQVRTRTCKGTYVLVRSTRGRLLQVTSFLGESRGHWSVGTSALKCLEAPEAGGAQLMRNTPYSPSALVCG